MKTLELGQQGGMPFEQDDLDWMQNGLIEAINRIIESMALGETTVILKGVEASANMSSVEISAGLIWREGKILSFGSTTQNPTNTPELDTDTTYDAAGNDTFKDSVDRDTYRQDHAVIAQGGAAMTQQEFIDEVNGWPRLKDYWHETVMEDWNNLTLLGSWTGAGVSFDYSGNGPGNPQYRKTHAKRVELRGVIGHASGATGTIATLPVGYRPEAGRIVAVPLLNSQDITPYQSMLMIHPNGNMTLRFGGITLSTYTDFCLDGISFDIG